MPITKTMQARIEQDLDQDLRVGDLTPGTLFRIKASAKNRLFVRSGDNVGPNGLRLLGAIDGVIAVVVPEGPDDPRAWAPAARLTLENRVASTHGRLFVG